MNARVFGDTIGQVLQNARESGLGYVDISAGEIHRIVGGYPGTNHRMPICCDVMYSIKKPTDLILSAPPKGKGAALTIRYFL